MPQPPLSEPERTALEEAERERLHWKPFGVWIRTQRRKLNLTKAKLAEAAGFSVSTWTSLEEGGRVYKGAWIPPSSSERTMIGIARALNQSIKTVYEMAPVEMPGDLEEVLGQPRTIDQLYEEIQELRAVVAELQDQLEGLHAPVAQEAQ